MDRYGALGPRMWVWYRVGVRTHIMHHHTHTHTYTHTHTPHTRYVPIGDYVVGVVHDTTKGGHSIIGAVGGVQFKQAPPIHALVRAGALPAVVGHVEV